MPTHSTDQDRHYLRHAVRLAMNGRGAVEPNPMVGCLIVRDGKILGQGRHEKFGGPHAEPNALAACTESPAGATVYVTLEPCCHTGKKTPPCVPALIAANVARVVVGCQDPNPQVSGRGITALREAGIHVADANDAECRQLIAPFIATTVHHRPYITLKWAQTADGKVAGPGGRRLRITNEQSNRLIHQLRSRCDAILVGFGTVQADDPLLTTRGVASARPLLRVVLDSDLRLPVSSQLVHTVDQGRVIVFCCKEAADYSGTRVALAACGVEIHPVSSPTPGRLDLHQVAEHLCRLGVTHLLVEPGPTLAASFLADGPWDRAWVFKSPNRLDQSEGLPAPAAPGSPIATLDIAGDTLAEFLNPQGIFSGGFSSADLVLAEGACENPT